MLLSTFAYPQQKAYARNFFKDTFRAFKKGTRFIIKLPTKATRWMGPVLGPIAATILTKNLIKHQQLGKIFNKASKVDRSLQKIENAEKQVAEMKKLYEEQSQEMYSKADELAELREELGKKLIEDPEYTYDDYKKQVIALDQLIDIHDSAGDKFSLASQRMNNKTVRKMLGKNILKTAMGSIKNAVLFEATKELGKIVDPQVVTSFLKSGGGGINSVIDYFVEGEISKALGKGDINEESVDMDELRYRVRNSIKNNLKKDAEFFKENWSEKINEILKAEVEKLAKETGDLEDARKPFEQMKNNTKEDKNEEKKSDENLSDLDDFLELEETTKCPTGYDYKPHYGVDCVQTNCFDIADAHLGSTGHCICGSVGSLGYDPDDANKICKYSTENKSCPGCVYACVHTDEDCPLEGIGAYEKK